MDKLTLTGRLTRDPELRVTTAGTPMCVFDVAVNNPGGKSHTADGQQPQPKYYRVTAWQKQAEACGKYLTKGQMVYVEGEVTASTYLSKQDGQPRASLNVSARQVEFLSSKAEAAAAGNATPPAQPSYARGQNYAPQQSAAPQGYTQVPMDDLPF